MTMSWRFFVHFTHLPLVQRAVYTGTLLTLGLGYAFAMIHVVSSHAGRDGDPMLSVDDIIIAYSGSKDGTHLESALKGPMSNMLPAEENIEIVKWIRAGTDEKAYDGRIKKIFEKRCIACHNNRNPHIPSLEDYEQVMHTAEADTGMNIFTLVRVSHIHLFGLTFIFYIVSSIFSHAYLRKEWHKIVIVSVPFIAIVFDIASWYITKIFQPFAWVVIISGAMMGMSFSIQFFVSIYQMWFYKLPAETAEELDPIIQSSWRE
ncbi:MAG TPA: elongation factor-1 alpha [Ectothiorhodospiraceae bacterium]|nr:elongation factor-1 alpha [Ectothiorhodospiraceae bacterium]